MDKLAKYTDEDMLILASSDIEAELKRRGYAYGWYKKEEYVGCIYILVNPAFENLVKIGYADDVQKRIRQLSRGTAVPDPYHCYAIYKVKKRLEDLKLHNLIDSLDADLRHSANREFYEMDCKKAYSILYTIAEITGSEDQLILNPFDDEYFYTEKERIMADLNADMPVVKASHDAYGPVPDGRYYFSCEISRWAGNVIEGTMRVENSNLDGAYIIEKGAVCCPVPSPSVSAHGHVATIREQRKNVAIVNNVLQEDICFNSPSGASSFLVYGTNNGWDNWKTKDNRPIDIFRKK